MDSLLSSERAVRQRAERVLELTNIETGLEQFGAVHLIGSYKYKVMVMRDIDFHVIVPKLSPDLASRFFQYLTSKELYNYVYFKDKHLFNAQAAAKYPSKVALDSYAFGLRLTVDEEEWQIGVNFITQHQETSNEIIKLFHDVTDSQRSQILTFKHLIVSEMKAKVSSAYIYRAVLEENIADEKELLTYLEGRGYSF